MSGKNYRDLIAWQKAMDFVEKVYHLTKQFPREELYGLTSYPEFDRFTKFHGGER